MKAFILSIFVLSMVCGFSTTAGATGTVTDKSTGITFPSDISFKDGGKDYRLQATGVATRKKFFVKVYSVAHYIQDGADLKGADKFQAILTSDKAKQLTIKWDHDAPAQKVQDGYRESFQKTLSAVEVAQIKPQIDSFAGFFGKDVTKGDEQVLRWLPGGRIEVIINGTSVGKVTNKDFAKGLWGIWLGDKSVVDRDNLISLIKQ